MDTRIIGIDLAVEAAHKAAVLDQSSNTFVGKLLTFHTDPAELDHVLAVTRTGVADGVRVIAVLEATGMAWYSVGTYLHRHGVEVYRVNGQQVADLRRVYQRHAKSDRIDARVLARLPLLCPDAMHPCPFPTGSQMALQRACREVARLKAQVAASKNRLLATDQFAWLGLSDILSPYSEAAFWVRANYYDPWHVREAGETLLAPGLFSSNTSCLVWPSVVVSRHKIPQEVTDVAEFLIKNKGSSSQARSTVSTGAHIVVFDIRYLEWSGLVQKDSCLYQDQLRGA